MSDIESNFLLCYRLVHRNDKIPNISINLKNREKQLFKPVLRLFQGTKAMNELLKATSKYVNERRKAKLSGLHAFLIKLIQDMMEEAGYNSLDVSQSEKFELSTKEIWTKVQTRTNGSILPGHPLSYDTVEFGTISQKRIAGILEDVFKAEIKSANSIRMVHFTKNDLYRVINAYNIEDVKVSISGKESSSTSTDSTDSTDSGSVSTTVENKEDV